MGSRPVGGRGGRGGIGGRGAMPGGPIGRQPQSLQFQELWLNINLAVGKGEK
ncbi:MAG: hypothetical protein GY863_20090 [bacterium]|nr:hypothetical protein [bacterium]